MYAAFQLDASAAFTNIDLVRGFRCAETHKEAIRTNLDAFLSPGGSIDASKLQADWFPTIDADVFVSHSHDDEPKAVAFAGWLERTFGLKCFIDSNVWGFVDDLLRVIDDKYCVTPNSGRYSYELRNHSTSHVHMIVMTALAKMIDAAEVLIFLDTPNSMPVKKVVGSTTQAATLSPWIYGELALASLLRRRNPRHKMTKQAGTPIVESLQVKYRVDVSHLHVLDQSDLKRWSRSVSGTRHALDVLYDLTNVR